jgi:putative two-component system response regulator
VLSLSKLFDHSDRSTDAREGDENAADDHARLALASALVNAWDRRDGELGLATHCGRVAERVTALAMHLGLPAPMRQALQRAALLHEVGMIGVPPELLRKPGPLTPEELAQVHAQAEFSASVAAASCGEVAATLIRHQYDDYETLRRELGDDPDVLLMAGLLNTADVMETVTHPRPYQSAIPLAVRVQLLRAGAGSRFDPNAVDAYIATNDVQES